jgi:dienelactone hydrolase
MRLTRCFALTPLILLAACGGGPNEPAGVGTTTGASTSTAIAPLDERAKLLAYDQSAPLGLEVRKLARRGDVEIEDVVFQAAGRRVGAFLVRPQGAPKGAVLWAHWYGEEPNTDCSEFLPDALALAREGVISLQPQGMFPWQEPLTGNVEDDRQLAVDQVVQLRRALDVLQEEGAGDPPIGFVGHDYGGMFGALLIADGRPQTYVLMAPDATFANWFVKYLLGGRGSANEYQQAFVPLDPVSYLGEAAPASVFLQFAETDKYVPGYVAERLFEAASEPKRTETYGGGHELDDAARGDRLAWLREELGLAG